MAETGKAVAAPARRAATRAVVTPAAAPTEAETMAEAEVMAVAEAMAEAMETEVMASESSVVVIVAVEREMAAGAMG